MRGKIYAARPGIRVVAVADTSALRKQTFANKHNIPSRQIYERWEDVLDENTHEERVADIVIIATPDQEHVGPAVAAASLGYHILIEKPLATTLTDCKRIEHAAKQAGVIVSVCHVLRYTPANQLIERMIRDGSIGEVLSINHVEPVGYWHFAHSFVRGSWSQSSKSTFSLMAKSCHDIDLLMFYMDATSDMTSSAKYDDEPCAITEETRNRCLRVSSFGSLQHFRKNKKPRSAGPAKRCGDCALQKTCPYSASRMYVDADGNLTRWSSALHEGEPDIEDITLALKTGPYGRCVYEHDNDVVDHQVVNFEYSSGCTVSFTMIATSERRCVRETTIYGATGELRSVDPNIVTFTDFQSGETVQLTPGQPSGESSGLTSSDLDRRSNKAVSCADSTRTRTGISNEGQNSNGHERADLQCVTAFVDAVRNNDHSAVLTSPEVSVRSHQMVFKAEQSRRLNGQVLAVEPAYTRSIPVTKPIRRYSAVLNPRVADIRAAPLRRRSEVESY